MEAGVYVSRRKKNSDKMFDTTMTVEQNLSNSRILKSDQHLGHIYQ